MLTHHCGIPNRKLIVPSSGSTTQVNPLTPSAEPSSSPRNPSSCRLLDSSSRMALSRGEVGLAHQVGGRALARHVTLPAMASSLQKQPPRHLRGLDRNREQLPAGHGSDAHEKPAGRECAQGRSASSWAASEHRVASSFGLPTSCTARGSPSGANPAGTEQAGWPVTFQLSM